MTETQREALTALLIDELRAGFARCRANGATDDELAAAAADRRRALREIADGDGPVSR